MLVLSCCFFPLKTLLETRAPARRTSSVRMNPMKGTEPQPACSRHTTAVKKRFSDQVDAVPLKDGDAITRTGEEGGRKAMVSGRGRQKGRAGAALRNPLSFGRRSGP